MPYELSLTGGPGDIQSKLDQVQDGHQALGILQGLRANVLGKEGVLKLMHTTDPKANMTFERKSWYQLYERRASKMDNTAAYLRGLFSKALDATNATEGEKQYFMLQIDSYLQNRNNDFGTKTLSLLVERFELLGIKPQVPQQEEMEQPQENKPGTPRARLVVNSHLGTEKLFEPITKDSVLIGKGGMGKAYLVKGDELHDDKVFKVESKPIFYPVDTKGSSFPLYRKGDIAACRFKDEPGIIKPQLLFLAVQRQEDLSMDPPYSELWAVPAGDVKKFIKQQALREGGRSVAVIGQSMPLAKGETVDKIYKDHQDVGMDPNEKPRDVGRGLFKALFTYGRNGIVHHDIKPQNMLFDEETGKVSVIDTGMVVKLSKNKHPEENNKSHLTKTRFRGGTVGFRAPQTYTNKVHGPEVDLYSAACVLLTMVEPDFLKVLQWINLSMAQLGQFPITQDKPGEYLDRMLELGKGSDSKSLRAATLRLEEKLKNNETFKNCIMDLFVASSNNGEEAQQAWNRLKKNSYLNGIN